MITLGWIGSILFALCGVPQVLHCVKTGNAQGLSWYFLLLWAGGELCCLVYVINNKDYPLICNYIINFISLLIIFKYKFYPGKK